MSELTHPHYPDAKYKQWHGGERAEDDFAQILPEYRGEEREGMTRIRCAPAARLDWSHDGGQDDIVGYWLLFDPSSQPTPSQE